MKQLVERVVVIHGLGWPGSELLSQVLRHSTIGAEAFDGRVRDGIGSGHLAKATRPAKGITGDEGRATEHGTGFRPVISFCPGRKLVV